MIPVDFNLKPGDIIGVAAPSARFDAKELDEGARCLEHMGFQVRISPEIYETRRYLAGSDETRARVLMSLFQDPEVKAIISARGGYGAMRLLSFLDWQIIRSHPTRFIGFSDATALISCLVSRAGLTPVHGPNLVSLARAGEKTLTGFKLAVTGGLRSLPIHNSRCLVAGTARGRLVGGNLATLAHMVGTRFQPDFSGSILFLEDVGEPAYKIDRMLTQMKLAGLFDRLRGVVFGDFHECANSEYIPEIITESFESFQIPVVMGLCAGHGHVNLAFPMGALVTLDTASAALNWENPS